MAGRGRMGKGTYQRRKIGKAKRNFVSLTHFRIDTKFRHSCPGFINASSQSFLPGALLSFISLSLC